MQRLKTLQSRIRYRIAKSKCNVFVLGDFADLSGSDQVGRALRTLQKKEVLVKIGYGIYAKTRYSRVLKKVVPIRPLPVLAREALGKLDIETAPTKFERLYNQDQSTQVPTGRVIGVKDRVSRKISYDGWEIKYEHVPR